MADLLLTWMATEDCDPPHAVRDVDNFERLAVAFIEGEGWVSSEPVLIGYPLNGRIQLLSGSHRWAAAKEAGIRIPVLVRQRSVVEAIFGDLGEWEKLMRPVATKEVKS